MSKRRISIASVVAVLALALAGCQSEGITRALAESLPNPVCRTLHDELAGIQSAAPSETATRGETPC